MDSLIVGSIGPAIAALTAINPAAGAIFGAGAASAMIVLRFVIPLIRKRRSIRKDKAAE